MGAHRVGNVDTHGLRLAVVLGNYAPDDVRRALQPARYYVHASPRGNRASIQARGLETHQPQEDGNWQHGAPMDLSDAPRGIYACPLVKGSDGWHITPSITHDSMYGGIPIPGHEDEPLDHWLIDTDGLDEPFVIDYADPDSDVLLRPVPPDHLRLLTP